MYLKNYILLKNIHLTLILFFSAIISILLCETILFSHLYSPDHLYLPVFLFDFMEEGSVQGWILPPSPYFFPDLFFYFMIYFLFPYTYLPTAYGVLQFFLFQVGSFWIIKKIKGQEIALSFLIHFTSFYYLFILLSFIFSESPQSFAFMFSSAHHTTGYFFILFFLGISLSKEKIYFYKSHLFKLCITFGIIFLYTSDRLSFALGFMVYFLTEYWKSKKSIPNILKKLLMLIIFISIGEVFLYFLKKYFEIPNSFGLLNANLKALTFLEIFFLIFHYIIDFFKIMLYQTPSVLLLFILFGFLLRYISKELRLIWISFFLLSLILSVIVGRFTYLHPFPIRYFFPLILLTLIFISLRVSPSKEILGKIPNLSYLILILLKLMIVIITLPNFVQCPNIRVKTKAHFKNNHSPVVGYEQEKPIRFWSEGRLAPLPVKNSGEPYHWITGGFRNRSNHTP